MQIAVSNQYFLFCVTDLVDINALFAVPGCLAVTNWFMVEKVRIYPDKQTVADSFILHVERVDNLETAKKAYEDKLKSWEQQIYPYVVACGALDNLEKFYVVINNTNHTCDNLLQAVQNCYFCLKALRSFPKISAHVWIFFERLIYSLKSKNYNFSGVNGPVDEILKRLKISDRIFLLD